MTVTAKTLIASQDAANTQTTYYTAGAGMRTILDKFTATNHSASAVTLSINLVASGGSASDVNLIVDTKSLAAGETYTFPEVVGHVLDAGGFVSAIASASASLSIRSSGREIT